MNKNLTTKERLLVMEQKQDTMAEKQDVLSAKQDKFDEKLDNVTEAVLGLPEELRKDFVVQAEYELEQKTLKRDVSNLKNDRTWIVRLVLASVVIAVIGLVIKL